MLKPDMTRAEEVAKLLSKLSQQDLYLVWKGKQGGLTGKWCEFKEACRQVAAANKLGMNSYIALNKPNYGVHSKPKDSDIVQWNNILVDIDCKESVVATPFAAADALEQEFPLLKSAYKISSGRGVQFIVPIMGEPVDVKAEGQRISSAINAWLRYLSPYVYRYGCVVDTSCSDLSRIFRCPGSVNQKNGEIAHVMRGPVGVAPALVGKSFLNVWAQAEQKARTPRPKIASTKNWNLALVLPHLSERAATFLIEGVAQGGRHSAAFAAGASLGQVGVPEELAASWIALGASRCRPTLNINEALQAGANGYRKTAKAT